jgi:hypothetical protein
LNNTRTDSTTADPGPMIEKSSGNLRARCRHLRRSSADQLSGISGIFREIAAWRSTPTHNPAIRRKGPSTIIHIYSICGDGQGGGKNHIKNYLPSTRPTLAAQIADSFSRCLTRRPIVGHTEILSRPIFGLPVINTRLDRIG